MYVEVIWIHVLDLIHMGLSAQLMYPYVEVNLSNFRVEGCWKCLNEMTAMLLSRTWESLLSYHVFACSDSNTSIYSYQWQVSICGCPLAKCCANTIFLSRRRLYRMTTGIGLIPWIFQNVLTIILKCSKKQSLIFVKMYCFFELYQPILCYTFFVFEFRWSV